MKTLNELELYCSQRERYVDLTDRYYIDVVLPNQRVRRIASSNDRRTIQAEWEYKLLQVNNLFPGCDLYLYDSEQCPTLLATHETSHHQITSPNQLENRYDL